MSTPDGRAGVVYRVSSRSFPNRSALVLPDGAAIVPRDLREHADNPYVAYRCLRHGKGVAVASNGSHTDALWEHIAGGMPVRDAMIMVLFAFDFEHDSLNTPRIAAVVRQGEGGGYLGIVRESGLSVARVAPGPGRVRFVATYALDRVDGERQDAAFAASCAGEALEGLFSRAPFAALTCPVCGVCAMAGPEGFEVAAGDAPAWS